MPLSNLQQLFILVCYSFEKTLGFLAVSKRIVVLVYQIVCRCPLFFVVLTQLSNSPLQVTASLLVAISF